MVASNPKTRPLNSQHDFNFQCKKHEAKSTFFLRSHEKTKENNKHMYLLVANANINQFKKYKHHNPSVIVRNHSVGLNRIKTFFEEIFAHRIIAPKGSHRVWKDDTFAGFNSFMSRTVFNDVRGENIEKWELTIDVMRCCLRNAMIRKTANLNK